MTTRPIKPGIAPGLTEREDPNIVYPSSDGEPMAESDAQRRPLIDTSEALIQHFMDRPDVYVSADMFIYYQVNDVDSNLAPDVFVVFGVEDHPRDSYFVWREGKAPDFVLEIASPRTYERDATEKRDSYASIGVTEYWRYDPTGNLLDTPLIGELLNTQGDYEPIPIAEREGILRGYSETLTLDICVRDSELRLFDPASQAWLRNLREETAARREEAAARQAEAAARREEAAARRVAEARVQALEQLLHEHGITPPNDA